MLRLLLIVPILLLFNILLHADEGMWLPYVMNPQMIEQMRARGLQLPFEAIYDENNASLKDAVVSLNHGGCSGEFVSNQGLLMTNHHCGLDAIQQHSSVANDYLKNGFWAASLADELPCPDMTASILISSHDVTERVLAALKGYVTGVDRKHCIDSISGVLAKEIIDKRNLSGEVVSFFEGNLFLFLVNETFSDVRLVGAPSSSVGNFGGEYDNWTWPRHTGDFSIFRVYASPDQKPARYSERNIPYQPRKVLNISTKGIDEGDFTMVIGYPGSTSRYATVAEIQQTQNIINPIIANIRKVRRSIYQQAMDNNEELRIKYASKQASLTNYWQYTLAQNEGFGKNNLLTMREQMENDLIKWTHADSARKHIAGNIAALATSYLVMEPLAHSITFYEETILSSSDLITFAYNITDLIYMIEDQSEDAEACELLKTEMKKLSDQFFHDFDRVTDLKMMQAMLSELLHAVPAELLPNKKKLLGEKYLDNINGFVDHLYGKSLLTDSTKLKKLLSQQDTPYKKILNDPFTLFMNRILVYYFQIMDVKDEFDDQIAEQKQIVMSGIMQKSKQPLYPDANSTLRLSYGTVQDYVHADGVFYHWQTTLQGIVDKAKGRSPNTDYFLPDEDQKRLLKEIQKGNNLPVCFITTDDITGGNSGSPVLNAHGELIGLAFDGNWEAMTSDFMYIPDIQRCICVDIRYVLFVMKQTDQAQRLLDELNIIN